VKLLPLQMAPLFKEITGRLITDTEEIAGSEAQPSLLKPVTEYILVLTGLTVALPAE
jgi:hypothetical protein